MLHIDGLRFSYANTVVLDGVDLAVSAGKIVSLVGPNGSGKSTLLKCLNGILQPSGGNVLLDGRPMSSYTRRERARFVAYVPQHSAGLLALPVVDMVGLGRAPHRGASSRNTDREVVMDAVQALGLESLAFRIFGELSGGERQRVLLARALAQEGRLLLLDEPTSALDMRHQLETMTTVREIVRTHGLGALVAIHDLGLASRFSDRLVMLASGHVHAQGTWKDVVTSEHLSAVYGVSALIGTDHSLPYVIPVQTGDPHDIPLPE